MSLSTVFIVAAALCFLAKLLSLFGGGPDMLVLGLLFFALGHLSFPAIAVKS